jgi:hypothetical protein
MFVCHSLGGIVVKKALIHCYRSVETDESLRFIYLSASGIIFFGKPHNKADIAKWGSLLRSINATVLLKKLPRRDPPTDQFVVSEQFGSGRDQFSIQ